MKFFQFAIIVLTLIIMSGCSPKLTGITKIKGDIVPIQKKTIIVFFAPNCDENIQVLNELSEINNNFNPKYNLAFVVNPAKYTLNNMHQVINNNELHFFKAYFDDQNKYAQLNKVKKTPYVFIVDKDANVLYQGAASNMAIEMKTGDKIEHYLLDALKAIEKGDKAKPHIVLMKGCVLE